MITFGVLLVHIEGYKRFNDEQGQAEGDQLLAKVARALVAEVGPSDILVRWDGARFMLICPNTKKSLLMLLAGKLKQVVLQTLNEKMLINDRYLRVYAAGTMSNMEDSAGTVIARILDYIGQSERATDNVLID
jgi:diguanylate cyclase (GGDEF)-like protein